MLVRISVFPFESTTQAFLDCLTIDDVIICCGDGVYACKAISEHYPNLNILAMQSDCADRGISLPNTLTSDTLCELHQQHQQWISI